MSKNFLSQFRDDKTKKLKNFTAAQFAEVWRHYDSDGNGFIEGKELDNFLQEFLVNIAEATGKGNPIGGNLDELKKEFMLTFDENSDNKIEISELARILPTEENFLLLFRRDNPLESSVDFMRIWKTYDKNCNGYIESNELQDFLHHILKESKHHQDITPEKLAEYTKLALELFDSNRDGRLQLSEMARLLPVKENFLATPFIKNADKLSDADMEKVFRHYDQDGNGTIENDELAGFLKDLLSVTKESFTDADLQLFKRAILDQWDVDHDGKINKEELKMMLSQQRRLVELEKSLKL